MEKLLNRWFRLCILALFTVTLVNCTRSASKNELRISIPSQSLSSQTTGSYLNMVIVNINIPGKPVIVKEVEYEHSSANLTMADPITIVIPDLPSANGVLVQFLGVYESQTGIMQFTYGDTTTDFKGGPVAANITAQAFGSATKEGQIGGRYFTSASGGPTGNLTGYFKPPNNRPKMAVDKATIFNGWFQVFALEGTNGITYVHDETGEVIFDDLKLSSTVFNTPSPYVVKANKPITYRQFYGSSDTEVDGEQDFILGFFQKPDLGLSFSGYEACYSTLSESVGSVYTDSTLTTPLVYQHNGTAGTHATIVGGGVSMTFTELFTTGCDTSTGQRLALYPHRLNSGHDSALGIRGPFKLMNPLARWGGFIDAKFQSAPDKITLKWKYLAGVENTAVSGVSVYSKFNQYGGGSSGGDHGLTCQQYAAKEGFSYVADVTGETYEHTAGVTNMNYYGFSFVLCPFKNNGGVKTYFNSYVRSDCIGGCSDNQHFGWGVSDATVSSNTAFTAGAVGGGYRRITSIDSSSTEYTVLNTTSGAGSFPVGGEVMLYITGEGLSASCGNHDSRDLHPTEYYFTRIIYSDTGTIKIPKGSFADSMGALSNLSSAPSANTDFCYVQAVHVPHFRNLTIGGGYTIQSDTFDYGNVGGGMVVLRVGGTLTLGSGAGFDASGKGFGAGTTGEHGAGTFGVANSSQSTNNGGMSASSKGGGGGGAYGDGADSSGGGMGGNGYSSGGGGGGFVPIRFGGAGGYGSAGAGAGGGAIYVTARSVAASGAGGGLWAEGSGAVGTNAGGGGGGSAALVAKTISGTAMNVYANGGAGNTAGGAGGGGFIKALYCSATGITWTLQNTLGASGSTTNGQGGNTDRTPNESPDSLHFCPQP